MKEHGAFKYGPPRTLLSDDRPQFVAHVLQKVCQILGVNKMFTRRHEPLCNSQVERFNCTLVAMLPCSVDDNPANRCVYVPVLCISYNMETHHNTATSPFGLMLSRAPPELTLEHSTRRKVASSQDDKEYYARRLDLVIQKADVSFRHA